MFYITQTGSYSVKLKLYWICCNCTDGSDGSTENAQEGVELPEATIRRRINDTHRRWIILQERSITSGLGNKCTNISRILAEKSRGFTVKTKNCSRLQEKPDELYKTPSIVQTKYSTNYYINLFNNQYRRCWILTKVTEEAGDPTEAPVMADVAEAIHQYFKYQQLLKERSEHFTIWLLKNRTSDIFNSKVCEWT